MNHELLTYSRLRLRLNCPFAEHLRYDQHLAPKAFSAARLLGSAVHKGLETDSIPKAMAVFDSALPVTQEQQNDLDMDKAVCRAMLEEAREAFAPLPGLMPEQQFRLPIRNPATGAISRSYLLAGKVDGICTLEDETWLVEYKTASTVDRQYIARLRLDGQVTTYLYAMERVLQRPIAGVIYRIIRKPSIRQTQKETFEAYCNRLEADYRARPDFYFVEERLYRSREDMTLFEVELWDMTQRMLWERKKDIHHRNTARCTDFGTCEYMPICLQEAGWEGLYEYKEANEELREDTEHGTVA